MAVPVDVPMIAQHSYQAFLLARRGARMATWGEGQWLYDILDWEGLDESEQSIWMNFAARIFGLAPELDGQGINELARVAMPVWTELSGFPAEGVFSGHDKVGLLAFLKAVCAFVAAYLQETDEDIKEDIEDTINDPFDWQSWGMKRWQQQEMIHASNPNSAG